MHRRVPRPVLDGGGGEEPAPTPARKSGSPGHSEPGRPYPYPHRLSVDVDDATYKALRFAAAKEGCTIVGLVRSGIARELEARR